MITLYRRNANSIGSWSIWAEGGTVHIGHSTVLGGSQVRHTEDVDGGKQGRSLEEQVESRIKSRISRMLDKGYKTTLEEAKVSSSNQLGLSRPMLAQPFQKVLNPNTKGAVQQKKLNGHRCLITKQDGELMAYTRQGKLMPSIKHIIKALENRVPEGTTMDGELYVHGQRLQTLSSWIKREQEATYTLNFIAYDVMSKDRYKDRHAELSDLCRGVDTLARGQVLVLPYEDFINNDFLFRRRDEVISNGFEGMMLRLDGRGYEDGKRSTSLIKVKKFLDGEFKVVDIIASEKDWAVCVCITKDNKFFKASAPGTLADKKEVLQNKHRYIGKLLTIQYAELTEDGVPFHASSTDPENSWRDDV